MMPEVLLEKLSSEDVHHQGSYLASKSQTTWAEEKPRK
jgi:hypothetical protein